MKIKLHVEIRVPNERVREFDLEFAGPEVLVGRDSDCDIQIPSSEVSRRHAKIYLHEGDWLVRNISSTQSIKLNGQVLVAETSLELNEGDLIEIAHAAITFHLLQDILFEESSEEKTSVVAQKMVRDLLKSSESHSDTPYLMVMNGTAEGVKVSIGSDIREFIIGRIENANLRINDVNISRKHARIKRQWNELLIEDLESKNGIVINGRKILVPTRLKDSDEIYLGTVHLTYVDPTARIIDRLEELAAMTSPDSEYFEPEMQVPLEPIEHPAEPDSFVLPSARTAFSIPLEHKPARSGIGVIEVFMAILGVTVFGGLIFGLMVWRS